MSLEILKSSYKYKRTFFR